MDKQGNKPFKPKVPHSDACDFYLLGFGTHSSGDGMIKITNRPPQFGVFFDGTGNNLKNDVARWDDDKAPTNVAKLFLLYPEKKEHFIDKKYIDGIGTKAGEEDIDRDQAFAFSIGDRVQQALKAAHDFFSQEQFKNAPIGILDVFGFSRGAAAARHFVNEVHRLLAISPKHFGGPQLQIRFLGLFDTVGSIGMPGDNSQRLYNGESFSLDIHPDAVQHAFQLTARHEQREYFPLSSLRTAPGPAHTAHHGMRQPCAGGAVAAPAQAQAAHLEELEIPGAHADVGGGYGPVPNTVYYPMPDTLVSLNPVVRDEKIKALKREYEQKYPAPGININMKIVYEQSSGPFLYTSLDPQWQRPVQQQLSHFSLHKMHAKAKEKGVPLEALSTLTQKQEFSSRHPRDVYEIPADLQDHLTRLEAEPLNTRIEEYVYRHYILHSHQYRAKPKPWAFFSWNTNEQKTDPDHATSNGKREVFYNETEKGYFTKNPWKRIQAKDCLGHWKRG